MTSAAHSGRWDISPGQDRDQDKENSVPVLSLVQFSKAPFVSFGAVTLGSSRSAVLRLQNPSEDTEARVTVDRVPAKKGFSVGQDRFTLEAGGVFSLQITWTPTEEGGLRELILFSANGVVKHQAVLLGRAEAPRRKKKTLWDSIKNKPGTGKVSGPRARRAVASGSKMAANKTFQVSQKAQSKRQSRSPLAALNRGSHRSSSAARRVLVNAKENQDFLTVPENKDLSKVLNKTLSPIGTPDRLKKLMPRIDPVDTALIRSSLGPSLRSPTLSITDALALIDSDLSPIRSSPQSSDFSDSLDSKSGRFGAASEPQIPLAFKPQIPLAGEPQIPLAFEPQTPLAGEPQIPLAGEPQIPLAGEPQTLLAIESRLTFCVSKNSAAHNVKMFTSTTVTKARAPVAATATSGRKIKRSRRRLLEQTLELSDCSSHSDSRAGTPCLPVIDADAGCTPGGGSSSVRPGPELSERVHNETISDSTDASLAANYFLFSSGLKGLCVASENREERTHVSFASCPAAEVSLRAAAMAPSQPPPSQPPPSQPPLFLASSPESFPVHLPAQGCKRKSQEFLSADAEAAGAEQGAQVKRSRAAPQKKTAAPQQRRAAASVSAVTTLRSAPQTALSSRPAARRTPSLKSAAHKSSVVAVAQSKLTFFKPTQTAMPRHPMSFAAKNMFFDERWMEKQERGFTWWINDLLTPEAFKVQPAAAKVSAAAVVLGGGSRALTRAPTREEMSFRTYTARRRLNRLRRAACDLFSSNALVKAIHRLELEVEARRLLVRPDRHLWKDIGERQKVLNWLLSYNPLWLRIGLETVFGELISLEDNGDTLGLALFILQRLLWNPDIAAEFRHNSVPHLYRDGHEEALSRFTLKKLLLLVCFLDIAKTSRIIEHDPCLFCLDAEFKSSKELLLAFSRDFLSGEGILPRHLSLLGLSVSHEQKPLDEFSFAVQNLAVDLKCGVRLVRVVELLVQDWSLSQKLRLPAISRLQKVHNVDLSLQLLKKKGLDLKDDHGSVIESRDIVDGHREKTLALLWKIIFTFHVEVVLDELQLKEEICFLRRTLKTKRRLEDLRTDRGLQPSPSPGPEKDHRGFDHSSPKIQLLMAWARAVCNFYSVKVENLTVSFSDGRVLCFLIHHYHPGLVPAASICLKTSQTQDRSARGRLQLDGESSDSDTSFTSSTSSTSSTSTPCSSSGSSFKELLENEKQNFCLVNSGVSFLGGVPAMIDATDMSNTIPNEKVVTSFLSFLCARLLDLRNETRAARVIQAAWRRHQLSKDLQRYQERSAAASKIQTMVRGFLLRRRAARRVRAAVRLQAAWRGHMVRRELRRQRLARQEIIQTHAATVIQAHWRRYHTVRSYQQLRYFTVLVQAQWRMRRAACAFRETLWAVSVLQTRTRAWSAAKTQRRHFLSVRAAAVTIQAAYRHRRALRTQQRHRAARLIQAAVQQWYQRRLSEKQAAALTVQTWYRMSVCVRRYQRQRESALLLQARFRSYRQRRQHRAATLIQSAFRGLVVRKQTRRMTTAATTIQRRFRATLTRDVVRQQFLSMKSAAVRVQAAYRGRAVRHLLKTQHEAATLLQASFRKYAAQKRYQCVRTATVRIQRKYRATRIAKETQDSYRGLRNAAVTLQAAWRGRRLRKELEERTRCAVVVQAWYRQRVAQRHFQSTKGAVLVLQKYFRAYAAGKSARNAFLDTRAATVSLQAAYRGMAARRQLQRRRAAAALVTSCVKMFLQRKRYVLLRNAAIVLQSRYKARVVGREQMRVYTQTKEATLTIQAAFRGWRVRRELQRQSAAATLIQAWFRSYRIRMAFLATKCAAVILQEQFRARRLRLQHVQKFRSMKAAAVTIQASFRGYKTRKHISEKHRAASIIQSAFKTYCARKQFKALKSAALFCQRRFRAVTEAKKQHRDFVAARKAVILLQSAWRGFLIRKELHHKHTAATVIQTHVRRYQQQVRYKRLLWAAGVLRNRFWANRQMREEMHALKAKRNAAVVIQAAFRGALVRKLLKHQREAAVVVQRAFKAYCQRQRFLALKLAAIIIQQRYRASEESKNERERYLQKRKCTTVIQAAYRAWHVRKEVARWHQAATVIQSAFRKHREEVKYGAMRLSAILIQKHYRSWILTRRQRALFSQTRRSVVVIQAAFRGQRARTRLVTMHKAATLIQASFRRYKQQSCFRQQQWAARTVQRRFRTHREMRASTLRYQQLKKAAVVLQAACRGLKARRRVKNMHHAASVVQTAFRAYGQRRRYLALKAAALTVQRLYRATVTAKKQKQQFQRERAAAVLIQATYRGFRVRREMSQMHHAATLIQCAFRKHRERVRFQAMRLSAVILQRHYRALLLQKQQRAHFLKLQQCTVSIQAIFRGRRARKELAEMHTAATVIQAAFRTHKERAEFVRWRRAARVLQQRLRAQTQMHLEQQRYRRLQGATVAIQAAYRGMKSRQRDKERSYAACVIQRAYRAQCERRRFLVLKDAALTIQRRYRATTAAQRQVQSYQRLRTAAVVVQAVCRGHAVRKELSRRHRAATVIQAAFRGYTAQMGLQALRLAAVIIQRRYRASAEQRRQREKFLQCKSSAVILQAAFRGFRVRKSVSRLHRAATVIQANFRRHRERAVFTQLRSAACALQRRFRAHRLIRFEMQRYGKKREAATVLQAAYRGMRARRRLKNQHAAAAVVQAAFRARRQRAQYLTLKAAAVTAQRKYRTAVAARRRRQRFEATLRAALTIQATYRSFRVRKEMWRFHRAATVIQTAFRRHRHEAAFRTARSSAVLIQRHYRCWVLRRRDRSSFVRLKRAAVLVQAAYRGRRIRRRLALQAEAVVLLQSQWRCLVQRRLFQRQKEAVLTVQRRLRALWLGKQQRADYSRLRRAALALQTHWRRRAARTQELEVARAQSRLRFTAAVFFHLQAVRIQRVLRGHWALESARSQLHAVLTVQRCVRAWLQRRRFREYRRRVVTAQRAARRWLHRRQDAARTIQRAARHFLLRRQQERVQRGIIKAQALWRGHRCRRGDEPRVVALRRRLEAVSARVRDEDKLCHKTSRALDSLLRHKTFSCVLEALRNLETATRLSPECCERLVESGATDAIFKLIRCCNRSVPSMEVINAALQVLRNLSKYHRTIEAVFSVELSVETLLHLLQRYREKAGDKTADKGGSIFTKTCFLLVLLVQERGRAQEVMKIPKALEQLQSIYRLTARKHKMDAARTVAKHKMDTSLNGNFFIRATPRRSRPQPRFAPDWVLRRDSAQDLVDPCRALQTLAEALDFTL